MASNQSQTLKVRGLFTNPSQFGEVPEGALKQADNVVIDRESIVISRRGMARFGDSFGSTSVRSMFQYSNDMIINTANDGLYYDSDQAGTWVQYLGTYQSPSTEIGSRIRSAEANKNIYYTTRNGIYKSDALTVAPFEAGAPKGLGGYGVVSSTPGFLDADANVAYRFVWGYKDLKNNLILGPPSERVVVSNTTVSTYNTTLTFQIPEGIDTTWFYQVYRSYATIGTDNPPNDELYLVGEFNPTSGEISAGFITYNDDRPDSLFGPALYTSPSEQGIDR